MTSDGDALFRAICEEPWEDTPRLVYADWLEENGDAARAEFIRVMIELARATDDPRGTELRARAEQLHRESRGIWTRGSPAGFGVRIGRELVRGFYNEVAFDGEDAFAESAGAVFSWTPIDTLTVRFLGDESVPAVLTSAYAARLRSLKLGYHCGDATCRAVADCPLLSHLTELVIWGACTRSGARALVRSAHLERVRHLHLGGKRALPEPVMAALKERFGSVSRH